jgi:DNA-3-methyladenine glycosylase II
MAKQPAIIVPDYWEEAKTELMRRDRILRKLIPKFGDLHLVGLGEPFITLARAIVGQQISVKAAQSVWERLVVTIPKLSPGTVQKAGLEKLASCGLSKRKAEYLTDLARHFSAGTVHEKDWSSMHDEDVIAELIQIRGIGRWTAEMFLIFSLLRPNVLPLDDLGLLKGISVNYFSGEPVSRSDAREVAANWEPWRTVGTWYLWRSLDPLPVEY